MGHKGETGAWDCLVMLPQSIWLSDEHLAEWEAKINSMQPAKASRTASKRKVTEMTGDDAANKEDHVESGMMLPASALNQCLESFTAADGNCIKASTQKFDSTGVMVLLCQHDQAIFLANMVTAGEKQFYAYTLIAVLLCELPDCWKVGLLCDVTCALQRSLVKWQFMPEWLDQIFFGVLIFHAYGHQWVCQLWYHPRKAELWGLSDGEGCECFWSELMRLIPCL
jgi:Kyakuja-Dileera-Zisupton transposase